MAVNGKLAASNSASAKPRGKPWKPGQSGNPKGRPPNEKTISRWFHEFGNQSPQALAKELTGYAKELRHVKGDLPMFGHVAIRSLMALINEPDARMLAQILDRTEGKVSQSIDVNWRAEAKAAGYDPDALSAEFARLIEMGKVDASDDTTATD